MIQSSQPVWSRREEPNLSESSLADGRGEPKRSESERSGAEDRSPPSQTGLSQKPEDAGSESGERKVFHSGFFAMKRV